MEQSTKAGVVRPLELNTDISPWMAKQQGASMVINGVNNSDDQKFYSLSNEPGTKTCITLTSGYTIVGTINLDNNSVAILSANGSSSEIGVARHCNYTALINNSCLGFSPDTPVKGTFRMRNGCERNIYFVDGNNTDKHINLDSLSDYYTTTYQDWLDGGQAGPSPTQWDCDSMDLAATFEMATITSIEVGDSGGDMPVGTLRLAYRYKDESGNVTPFFTVTERIKIYDEKIASDYNNITGGYDEAAGFTEFVTSSKTVTVTLGNIDESYSSVEFAAIHYISGDGITPTVYLIDEKYISGSTWSYTYSGPRSTSVSMDIAEIQIDPVVYPTSKEITQFDNRLIRANVCSTDIDWKEFQTAANDIVTTYIATEVDAYDQSNERNAKNPLCKGGFMADEVYAFGIRWYLNDGTAGPVLHIPGREADESRTDRTIGNTYSHIRNDVPVGEEWDTQELEVVTTITSADEQVLLRDVRHLGVTTGDDVFRWKVYNTAQPTGLLNPLAGIMGYHETLTTYPDERDCNGVPIYPHTDNGGGSYTMHNIRHHRMPDSNLVHTFEGDDLRHLSAAFTSIAPPAAYASQVQGYEIVMADPEKTVLAKGLYTYLLEAAKFVPDGSDPRYYQPMPFYQNSLQYALSTDSSDAHNTYTTSGLALELGAFVGPEFRFENQFPNGAYLKFEGLLEMETSREYEIEGGSVGNPTYLKRAGYRGTWDTFDDPLCSAREISNELALGYDRAYSGFPSSNDTVDNRGEQQEIILFELTDEAPNYTTFETIEQDSSEPIGGISFVHYVSVKNTKDVYSDVTALSYESISDSVIDSGTTNTVVTNGDTIVAPFVHKKNVNHKADGFYFDVTDHHERSMSSFSIIPIESRTNFALAHETSDVNILYKNINENDFMVPYFEDRDEDTDEETHYDEHLTAYNPDFFVKEQIKRAFMETSTGCSSCRNCYPNMVIFSGVAAQDNVDAYKTTLANNYTQTEGTGGDITGMFAAGRSLFLRTERSLFEQTPSAASLKSDGTSVYLGTGEFFSLPSKEISQTDYGYAGSQDRFDLTQTQFGTFYVDRTEGIAYQFINGQLNPISDSGVSRWFKERLPSQLINELTNLGIDYSLRDAFSSTMGLGVQTVYDPWFKRVIFNVKDFYPLFSWTIYDSSLSYTFGDYVFDTDDNKFYLYDQGDVKTEMAFNNLGYFENRSWTISYDPRMKTWVSFHSYHPAWMYNTQTAMYTSLQGAIYDHQKNINYTNFYGTRYPFVVETVTYKPNTSTLENVTWSTQVEDYDATTGQYLAIEDSTFDQAVAYTAKQSTGLLTNIVQDPNSYDITYNQDELPVTYTDSNWKASRFKNQLATYTDTMFTSAWADSEYVSAYNAQGQGFIDKAPLTSSYSTSKSYYELDMLRDKYHYTRLFYNPELDYRITVDNIMTKTKHSFR